MKRNELEAEMIRKGFNQKTIAKELGLNHTTLYKKMAGITDFKVKEVEKIQKLLDLTDEQILNIFFKVGEVEELEEEN